MAYVGTEEYTPTNVCLAGHGFSSRAWFYIGKYGRCPECLTKDWFNWDAAPADYRLKYMRKVEYFRGKHQ